MTSAHEAPAPGGWSRFWNAGGFWKAVLLVVGYWLAYQAGGLAIHALSQGVQTSGGPFASPQNVFFGEALPILLASVWVLLFLWSLGWLPEIFGRQPIPGRGWMWIAVAVVLIFNLVRFAAVDYTAVGVGVTVATLLLGLCVGLTEELVFRGGVVVLLRRAGFAEWAVAVLSSALFALTHAANYLGTSDVLAAGVLVGYTFAFGILMYLTMRVTGHIIWAMLVHATTDPSLFLLTTSEAIKGGDPSPIVPFANLANVAVILAALVLVFFIRGRVTPAPQTLRA